jgi:hypothetical protein
VSVTNRNVAIVARIEVESPFAKLGPDQNDSNRRFIVEQYLSLLLDTSFVSGRNQAGRISPALQGHARTGTSNGIQRFGQDSGLNLETADSAHSTTQPSTRTILLLT